MAMARACGAVSVARGPSSIPRLAQLGRPLRPLARRASTPADARPAETHFGFQTVDASRKADMVGDVFRRVAENYDLMNDVMSGTMHRFWKDEFVRMMGPIVSSGDQRTIVLDVAGGTGDIAFRVMDAMRASLERPAERPHVIVCDINPAMLDVGRQRADELGYTSSLDPEMPAVSWVAGDAERLPIASDSIDLFTIAFGIRNVTRVDAALREAHRVLRPGGRFMCLEFSHVHTPVVRQAYDAYSFNVIPLLGQLVANDRPAYQYLVESIRRFPDQEAFSAMIRDAGFADVSHVDFTLGVCAVHSGFKLAPASSTTPSVERDRRSGW